MDYPQLMTYPMSRPVNQLGRIAGYARLISQILTQIERLSLPAFQRSLFCHVAMSFTVCACSLSHLKNSSEILHASYVRITWLESLCCLLFSSFVLFAATILTEKKDLNHTIGTV